MGLGRYRAQGTGRSAKCEVQSALELEFRILIQEVKPASIKGKNIDTNSILSDSYQCCAY